MMPALRGFLYERRAHRAGEKKNDVHRCRSTQACSARRALRALENRCAATRLTVYGMDACAAASSLSEAHTRSRTSGALAIATSLDRVASRLCMCGVGDCVHATYDVCVWWCARFPRAGVRAKSHGENSLVQCVGKHHWTHA